jgi:hypothetical protein
MTQEEREKFRSGMKCGPFGRGPFGRRPADNAPFSQPEEPTI